MPEAPLAASRVHDSVANDWCRLAPVFRVVEKPELDAFPKNAAS
jgi:hypothetical protein